MAKTKEYTRWAITGECGLYVGQRLTRYDAIAEHVAAKYGTCNWVSGRSLDDEQMMAWNKCKQLGDRAVKVRIIVPVGGNAKP